MKKRVKWAHPLRGLLPKEKLESALDNMGFLVLSIDSKHDYGARTKGWSWVADTERGFVYSKYPMTELLKYGIRIVRREERKWLHVEVAPLFPHRRNTVLVETQETDGEVVYTVYREAVPRIVLQDPLRHMRGATA